MREDALEMALAVARLRCSLKRNMSIADRRLMRLGWSMLPRLVRLRNYVGCCKLSRPTSRTVIVPHTLSELDGEYWFVVCYCLIVEVWLRARVGRFAPHD